MLGEKSAIVNLFAEIILSDFRRFFIRKNNFLDFQIIVNYAEYKPAVGKSGMSGLSKARTFMAKYHELSAWLMFCILFY